MGFSTNYENLSDDYGLVPEGKYEAVIRNIEERTTQNGKTGLNLSLVIRNDVEQKFKDRYIFHTLWKVLEPTDADRQVQGYSFNQIMNLARSAKLPSGKVYEDVKALCQDLLHKTLLVTVEHDTYNGKTRERVKYMNESKVPVCKHVFKEKKTSSAPNNAVTVKPLDNGIGNLSDFEEIVSDGDVPF